MIIVASLAGGFALLGIVMIVIAIKMYCEHSLFHINTISPLYRGMTFIGLALPLIVLFLRSSYLTNSIGISIPSITHLIFFILAVIYPLRYEIAMYFA